MSKVFHPFIVDFVASFQDEKFIYMVVHLIQGGELFSRVHDNESNTSGIPEKQAKFYALCIADALAYLHRLGYVFRGRLATRFLHFDSQISYITTLQRFEDRECDDRHSWLSKIDRLWVC